MAEQQPKTVRLIIAGRVQGVAFRAWTKRCADKLGITGWVRNRHDGAVEVAASGSEPLLAEFIESCRKGPMHAAVLSLTASEEKSQQFTAFEIAPTV